MLSLSSLLLSKQCNLQTLPRINLKYWTSRSDSQIFTCKRTFSTKKTKLIMNNKLIAIGQMRSTHDKELNRQQVKEIVQRGVEGRACFIFLPECCDYVARNSEEAIKLAEPLSGETANFYKKLAKDNKVWLSLGGIHESIIDNNGEKTKRMHNSHVIIDDSGNIVDVYRKLHLFDVDTPEFKFRESNVVTGGDFIVAPLTNTPLDGHQLGLLICYDLRFPEVSTILRKKGATILTYPSAFAYSTGLAHWDTLLRARAIETQSYVIAAAQIGYHNEKRRSYGHAMVIDPWGKIMAECDNETDLDCKLASVPIKEIDDIRSRMPCFEHRRDNVYLLNAVRVTDKNLEAQATFNFENHIIPRATIFYETAMSVAFTNICCVVPGHILVASRRQAERLKDLTTEEVVDFFLTVSKMQKLLEGFYQTSSATVTVQDGQAAGQTVKHVHCHIMPRKEGDFEHNDQIYIELNKHDHPDSTVVNRKLRSIDERSDEASKYKEAIKSLKGL